MDEKPRISSQLVVKIESEGICRLCARRKDDCNIDVLTENDQNLVQKIREMLKVKIKSKDEWHVICSGCCENVEKLYEFYENVQKAQKYFKEELLVRKQIPDFTTEIKEEELEPEIKLEQQDLPEFESQFVDSSNDFDDTQSTSDDDTNQAGRDLEKIQSDRINKFYKFKCTQCKSDFRTFMMYQIHMRKVHHDENPTVVCCNMTFPCQRGKLLEHYLMHTSPEELQCRVCSKQYMNKRAKRRHEKSHMEKKKRGPRLPCPNCDRVLADRASLQSHIKNMHTPDNLRQKYQCDLCKKELTTKFSVLNHLIVKHKMQVDNPLTNNEEILCPFCAKCFKNRSTYNYHYQVKHNITMTVCPECGIEMNKKSLRSHMRRTHDYQAQNCPICHKQFRNNHAVLLHKNRVHVDAKHKCDICEKMFKMKDKLKEHRKGHIIEKNRFYCDICSVTCNDYSNILKHRRQVHPNATPIPHGMGRKILEIGFQ